MWLGGNGMTVIMFNAKENDYTVVCNHCGSEEICDHEFKKLGADLESQDYCYECCPRCEKIGKCNICSKEKELMPDGYDTCNSCMYGEEDE
jgi:hypothetical protein